MPLDDIPELDEVDAVLDGLSSPTSLEVYDAMQPYNNDTVIAAATQRAVNGGGGGGGGSVPFVGNSPPASPTDGELWWDPDDDTPVGGSMPDDWLNVQAFSQSQAITHAGVYAAFAQGDDPAPRGTAVTWDIGTPDTVNINTTGIYDLAAKLIIGNASTDTDYTLSLAEILIHDDDSGPGYSYDVFPTIPFHSNFTIPFAIPGVALEAGEFLKLFVQAGPDPAADNLTIVECVMTVSRRG